MLAWAAAGLYTAAAIMVTVAAFFFLLFFYKDRNTDVVWVFWITRGKAITRWKEIGDRAALGRLGVAGITRMTRHNKILLTV